MNLRREGLSFVLAIWFVGCGGGAPDDAPITAPVRGKITRKGAPLADVLVVYQPQGTAEGQPGSPSTGVTNAAGEYVLAYTQSLSGALPGNHRVVLSAGDGLNDDDPSKKAPDELVIPPALAVREVTVPAEGLNGGAADFDLDF